MRITITIKPTKKSTFFLAFLLSALMGLSEEMVFSEMLSSSSLLVTCWLVVSVFVPDSLLPRLSRSSAIDCPGLKKPSVFRGVFRLLRALIRIGSSFLRSIGVL